MSETIDVDSIQYTLWTRDMLKNMSMRYFLKRRGEQEKEVDLDTYVEAARRGNRLFGLPADHVPKIFIDKDVSGHIDPEVLRKEGMLVS